MKKILLVGLIAISIILSTACSGNADTKTTTAAQNETVAETPSETETVSAEPETTLGETETAANETEKEDPLGFNVLFDETYRNDVTGNWRLARIAENINIEEYAVDYYNNYFKADNEIHIIVNFTLNTTTRISVMGNLLDVAIMEYVDKEEHDAALACSGMLLAEYHVNIESGEIEKIQ